MCCYRRLACLLVILIVPLFVSGDQASAYFSEDSFVSSWKEKVNLDLTPCKQSAASFYTVCQGDTLWSISRRFGVDQDFIVVVNGIRNRDLLHPGQMLLLPGLPEGVSSWCQPITGAGSLFGLAAAGRADFILWSAWRGVSSWSGYCW
jgi:hypothetical protein